MFGGRGGNKTSTKSKLRQPVGNVNLAPYTYSSSASRFRNYKKRRFVASDADRSKIRLRFGNFTASGVSESSAYVPLVIKSGIRVGTTVYPATFNGASEVVLYPGQEIESDDIANLTTLTRATAFWEGTRTVSPLLYNTRTSPFVKGMTVTGGTSNATGLVQFVQEGTTGYLVLTGETGTFQNGEPLTGVLAGYPNGAATADLTTTQNYIYTVTTRTIFQEGAKAGQDSSIDYTVAEPVVYPVYTANLSGANIASCSKTSGGSGYTVSPSIYAYEYVNNILYSKSIGYGNLSAGAVNSVTVTSGTPPSGLAAWVNPIIVAGGGSGYGIATAGFCALEVSGIPSVPVHSIKVIGTSIERGDSSTDTTGDLYSNCGIERVCANEVAIINMSRASASASYDAQYASIYPKLYKAYMGKTTHCLVAQGTNDITAGRTEAQVTADLTTIANYARSFGEITDIATILPRVTGTYTTEGGQTPVSGFADGGVRDQINVKIRNNTTISDRRVYDHDAFFHGVDDNKFRVDFGAITADGIHPSLLGFGVESIDPTLTDYFSSLAL